MVADDPAGASSPATVALVAAAAIAWVACALFLRAGALERRGLPGSSRALARRAGLWIAAGTLLEIPPAGILLLRLPAAARNALLGSDPLATVLLAVAAAASLGAGATALLGGLAGKPRPSGGFAAALLALAAAAGVLLHLHL
jgi:hypothetical protein